MITFLQWVSTLPAPLGLFLLASPGLLLIAFALWRSREQTWSKPPPTWDNLKVTIGGLDSGRTFSVVSIDGCGLRCAGGSEARKCPCKGPKECAYGPR